MNISLRSISVITFALSLVSCQSSRLDDSSINERQEAVAVESQVFKKENCAEEAAKVKEVFGKSVSLTKGKVLFESSLPHEGKKIGFSHGSMEKLAEGGVLGKTDPKYKGHAANYAVRLDHEDAIYQFEIKLDDDKSTGGIRVGYHMAGCGIATNKISVGKNEVPFTLTKKKWHLVTVTRVGQLVSLKVGDTTIEGQNEKLKPTIDAIRLTVKGVKSSTGKGFHLDATASYRNLKIWKAIKK